MEVTLATTKLSKMIGIVCHYDDDYDIFCSMISKIVHIEVILYTLLI